MARQAMWIHGNAVMLRFPGGAGISPHTHRHQMNVVKDGDNEIAWTDIVGLHQGNGVIFCGRRENNNTFHASIPTPCWRDGIQAQLAMVGLLFTSDAPVIITGIRLFDGPNPMPFSIPSMNLSGSHTTLVSNVNRFDLGAPLNIHFGLGLAIDVTFNLEGNITFHTLGADFIV